MAIVLLVISGCEAPPPTGVLAPLQVGTQVGVKEDASGFTVTVTPGVNLGHTVTELGRDFVVVEDVTRTTQTRIPLTSIKCVKVVKPPAR